MAPQMEPHKGQDIAKCSRPLVIPGSLFKRKLPIRSQSVPKEGYETVEPKEQWGRALNCQIRPLALRLDTQVRPTFLECRFQAPAFHEITDNFLSRLPLVGGKQRFRRSLSRWVTGQDPANGQRGGPKAIPPGGPSAQFQRPLALLVPVQGEALPHGLWIMQDMFERGKSWANHRRPTARVFAAH